MHMIKHNGKIYRIAQGREEGVAYGVELGLGRVRDSRSWEDTLGPGKVSCIERCPHFRGKY